jgi:beta-xylosidase
VPGIDGAGEVIEPTPSFSPKGEAASLDEIQIRDPFIVVDPATRRYFLHGTTGFGEAAHGGFLVRSSDDLMQWSKPKPALAVGDGPSGATHFWAPEVFSYRGRWYLFGSVMHGTDLTHPEQRYTTIFVADAPDGPFRAYSSGPLTPPGWTSIDGTLHVEPDGTPWMIFVREWVQVTDGEMHAVPLTRDLRATAGNPVLLFRASEAAWSLPQSWAGFSGYRVTDGPWLHRTKLGDLLMLWSTFGPGGYVTGIARSKTGTVMGPWVQSPQPLFAGDGGHAMIFRTFEGTLMMALHSPNRPPTERARFLPIEEVPGGLAIRSG